MHFIALFFDLRLAGYEVVYVLYKMRFTMHNAVLTQLKRTLQTNWYFNYCKKAGHSKYNVKNDQIMRQKLQISQLLILKIVLHVTWNSPFTDAE
jgi:hypothetical protein